ncbi:phenylacetate-CoA oxygenase subunit PaaJ [Duganella sp. Leaf126]|uniref:1,2-phenylacetyl-CoA epoxidase subunit PaaD n=1 Tax=Duganella sp. Leaf126 TaxID=1736266 RepID=UPI0006F59F81|nr:phenylacetate-CoA oxygenase subunit PaaJ [Duganella sp. Leaf126]
MPAQAGVPSGRSSAAAGAGYDSDRVFGWLNDVPDPEIPPISIIDLGIVRAAQVTDDGACHVTITPTYSGCPAMQVIGAAITEALHAHGVREVVLHTQLSPAWTTDWISETGKQKLRNYGIAPPAEQVIDTSRLGLGPAAAISRRAPPPRIACPHCGSTHTAVTSQFGSTPCKALYRCFDCREPFDYFKCH